MISLIECRVKRAVYYSKRLPTCLKQIVAKILVTAAFSLQLAMPSNAEVLIYPKVEAKDDKRQEFPLQLLEAMRPYFTNNYVFKEASYPSQQDRAMILLEKGEIDILWTGTSRARENEARAIRIPMYKGLLGWRLVLLKEDNANLLKDVKTLRELRNFSVGLGGGWPDVGLFSDNYFLVHTTTSYEALFHMLQKNRFDLFPRSVIEIWQELEAYSNYGISVDPYIVIQYPYAAYYFVNKNEEALAKEIETGFKTIIDNGEYDKIFEKFYGELLRKARLSERKIFRLENQFFPSPSDEEQAYFYVR